MTATTDPHILEELKRLRTLNESLVNRCAAQSDVLTQLAQKRTDALVKHLQSEITRLKDGRFTPDELQNLCHNLNPDDLPSFRIGCLRYQRQLFGPDACAVTTLREMQAALRAVGGPPDLAVALTTYLTSAILQT